MVGRDVGLALDAGRAAGERGRSAAGAGRACRVSGLTVEAPIAASTAVNNLSFDVAPGEILGIAGVEGNGQTELLEAIAGLRARAVRFDRAAGRA